MEKQILIVEGQAMSISFSAKTMASVYRLKRKRRLSSGVSVRIPGLAFFSPGKSFRYHRDHDQRDRGTRVGGARFEMMMPKGMWQIQDKK